MLLVIFVTFLWCCYEFFVAFWLFCVHVFALSQMPEDCSEIQQDEEDEQCEEGFE